MGQDRIEHRGCKLAYEVRGNGPPVVFIQGVGVHGDGWKPQIDPLSLHYQCMSFDNRGMAKSQPIGVPVTVEQMGEDTLALMDAIGWESAHVVGHSMGGLIALNVALTAPKRVRSLSLLCTFADGRDAAPLTPRMIWLGMRTRIGTRRMRRNAFLRLVMFTDSMSQRERDELAVELEPLFGHDLADQPPIVSKQLSAMRKYDAKPRLGELSQIPTLIVNAEHDPISPPKVGRAMHEAMRGSKYVEMPNVSHGVPIQSSGEINVMLRTHIDASEK